MFAVPRVTNNVEKHVLLDGKVQKKQIEYQRIKWTDGPPDVGAASEHVMETMWNNFGHNVNKW